MLFFLLRRLIFDLLYFLALDESDSLDDESDNDGSDSGSSGTYSFCAFYLHFDDSVGSFSVLGFGIFAPTGIESKGNTFVFGVFILTGVDSKSCRLIEIFWRSNSLFSFQI